MLDPSTGLMTWHVPFVQMGAPGLQCLASGAPGDPSGAFAVQLRYGRCPRVFACERRLDLLNAVQGMVKNHLQIVFALGPQERQADNRLFCSALGLHPRRLACPASLACRGKPAELLDAWHSRERDRMLASGEAAWGEWTARKLREYVSYPENATLVSGCLVAIEGTTRPVV